MSKSGASKNALWIGAIDLTRAFWTIATDGAILFGAKLENFPDYYFVPVKKLRYRSKPVKSMLAGLKVMYVPHGVHSKIVLLLVIL